VLEPVSSAKLTTNSSMRDQERGSAILEFGLIAVVLFTLIFGIIDFGRALFAYHFVANAAREGTRYASVRGYACQSPMTGCDATQASIQTYLQNEAQGSGLNPNLLSVDALWPPETTNPAVCTQTPNYPGCTVQVQVSYPFKFIFPFLPKSTVNMSSTSAMVITQ
jgi:Flp pilus assembly protein TadG